MTLPALLVQTYVQMLGALSAWLAKAAADGIAIEAATPIGMTFDLTAEQYARDWALPQFYFHVLAAYAILRAQGIELGKADYIAHMFAFLRPPVTP